MKPERKVYRLTRAVENPVADKRHRHGLESWSSFPGRTVVVVTQADDRRTPSFRLISPEGSTIGTGTFGILNKPLHDAIMAAAEPIVATRTFVELVATIDDTDARDLALPVLEALIVAGKVKMEDVRAILGTAREG